MNWQVRNPLHCTADGCTAKAEIEALREKVAEWERGDRQYPQAVQDYKDLCVELKRTQVDLAAITEECNLGHTLYSKSLDDLAAMTKERDEAGSNCSMYKQQVLSLTQERDTLNAALDAKITICGDASLAAAQARIKELREALERMLLCDVAEVRTIPMSCGALKSAREALEATK